MKKTTIKTQRSHTSRWEPNKGRGGRRGSQSCQEWNNNSAIGSTGKFKGKTPGIEYDILGNTGVHDAANFHRYLKHIADHLQLACDNEVCKAICTHHDTSSHQYSTGPKRVEGSK